MRNERTPRTLADCSWQTGYPTATRRATGAIADYALAVFIGFGLACAVFFNI